MKTFELPASVEFDTRRWVVHVKIEGDTGEVQEFSIYDPDSSGLIMVPRLQYDEWVADNG